MKGPQPQKGGQAKTTVSIHLNEYFLRDTLSSVSEQAVKRPKNRHFLLLGLYGTVVLNREASDI